MKTSNNTVLIIGGSAGIGYEIAKQFVSLGNKVIITGRSEERLQQAAASLGNVRAIKSDVTDAEHVKQLVARLENEFPELNIVINNAATAFLYTPGNNEEVFEKASEEMFANYLSVVRLNEYLLPAFKQKKDAAIVNVSSIVALAPSKRMPGYAASKAALHSYSQTLRLSLQDSSVKVFELMPPLVNTQFSEGIGGINGIAPAVVADELLKAMEADNYEIHVGTTADIFELMKKSPNEALAAVNAGR
ncbi:MAG: SDR family NAD(P)-dependent oxidoreductase [Bacteroidetes bacterium]|nr:SDR family NAD(P)-dependent oxidoreductase [Bacteroidota bacterium]